MAGDLVAPGTAPPFIWPLRPQLASEFQLPWTPSCSVRTPKAKMLRHVFSWTLAHACTCQPALNSAQRLPQQRQEVTMHSPVPSEATQSRLLHEAVLDSPIWMLSLSQLSQDIICFSLTASVTSYCLATYFAGPRTK